MLASETVSETSDDASCGNRSVPDVLDCRTARNAFYAVHNMSCFVRSMWRIKNFYALCVGRVSLLSFAAAAFSCSFFLLVSSDHCGKKSVVVILVVADVAQSQLLI